MVCLKEAKWSEITVCRALWASSRGTERLAPDNVWSLMRDVCPAQSSKIQVTLTLPCVFKNVKILKLSLLLCSQTEVVSRTTLRFDNLLVNNSVVPSNLCYSNFQWIWNQFYHHNACVLSFSSRFSLTMSAFSRNTTLPRIFSRSSLNSGSDITIWGRNGLLGCWVLSLQSWATRLASSWRK